MSVITVLAGGTSNEREVSLRSGAAVANALASKGHQVTMLDPANGLGELGRPDVVFLALHGKGGEDGTIQEALEHLGLPYTGSGIYASRLCFNKWDYRQALKQSELPVAPGEIVQPETFWQSELRERPFILKPIEGGSSIGTMIIHDPDMLDKTRVTQLLLEYGDMLLESLIEGTEITVGVLGEKALTPVEIIPPEGAEFDYNNKYNGKTQVLCPPQHLTVKQQEQAKELAMQIHRRTGCRDLSRTDMIVRDNGEIIALETNTLPGMADTSLLPKSALVDGISMPELTQRLVDMALRHPRSSV